METDTRKEGWLNPDAKKWHYFRDGRSLCGSWGTFQYEYDKIENIDSPDNCKTCRNKRIKELRIKEKASEPRI